MLPRGKTREDFGSDHIFGAVMEVAPLCKHPGFAEEREWRLLFGPVSVKEVESVHFVERRHTLAPYIEFRLAEGDNVLDDIQWIAGPGPQQERASLALGMVAQTVGMTRYQGIAQPHALPALGRSRLRSRPDFRPDVEMAADTAAITSATPKS